MSDVRKISARESDDVVNKTRLTTVHQFANVLFFYAEL